MPYQVDIWSGDLHQTLYYTATFENWSDAVVVVREGVEIGLLCNVIHTDFKAPDCRQAEVEAAIIHQLRGRSDDAS